MSTSNHELFASSARAREQAAATFTVFPSGNIPPRDARYEWDKIIRSRPGREEWPADLAAACANDMWPRYAFGTANAAVLFILHRPGMTGQGLGLDHIPPSTPTLGGIGHAHVRSWQPQRDKTWSALRAAIREGLSEADLEDPLSAVMTTNINITPGSPGEVDAKTNEKALMEGGHIHHVINTTQPVLIVACGRPVWSAIASAKFETKVINVTHPSVWNDVRHKNNPCAPNQTLLPALRALADYGRGEA